VIVLVIAGSLALPWWTLVKVLVPRQEQARALTSKVSGLQAEVDKGELKWPKEDATQIRENYEKAQSRLFANEEELKAWLTDLQQRTVALGFDVKIDMGKAASPAITNSQHVAIVPASISLEVTPLSGGTESPYQRLLRLTQQLATGGKRADLAQMTVEGGTRSIPRALLVFSLWASEGGER
jgi:hypothetical protein